MSPDHSKTIIAIKDISFAYGNESILKHVTLDIHQGDYIGVIGPNGGGKTTLLKIILGLLKPTSGIIELFGKPQSTFNEWWHIGYVPQKAVQFDTNFPVTVEEVVAMGLFGKRGLFRLLNKEDRAAIDEALERVQMHNWRKRRLAELSGGQQQRVFIARALAAHPTILLLDEPTVGVDIQAQEAFYSLLKELNQNTGLTLLLVSHDIDVVAHEATELACVNQTVIYHGEPKEFIKGDYLQKLYGKNVRFILHDH